MIYVALAVNAAIIAFSRHTHEQDKRTPKDSHEILLKMVITEHVVFFLIFAIS